jgi:PAS domain S-box-containing protein
MCAGTRSDELRERARRIYEERGPSAADDVKPEKLIEELRIHQIELELQNQELQQARAEAEAAQKTAEAARDRYYTLFHRAPAGHLVVAPGGRIDKANARARELLGIGQHDPPPSHLYSLLPSSEASHAERALTAAAEERPRPVTLSMPSTGGEQRFIELSAASLDPDGGHTWLLVSLLDVTAREREAEYHQQNVQRYRRLLRELNHRVKNNLQILSSIVELERSGAAGDERLGRIAERIRNVSHIHTALHDSATDVDEVDAVATLRGFVDDFRGALPLNVKISFTSALAELRLESARTLTLCLLVNELITNSVRHAFPAGRRGSVDISLASSGRSIHVTVSDNGVGMPEASEAPGDTSEEYPERRRIRVGTELARQLARDLDARWTTRSGAGVRHDVVFRVE